MQDSIFTKIIKGEILAEKVYEDELTIAFLTIQPRQPGHTLVVPKKQIDQLWYLPEEDYSALMSSVKKVARRMKEVLGVARIGELVIGEEVPHAHVHLIPFNTVEEFNSPAYDATPKELAEIAKRLAF